MRRFKAFVGVVLATVLLTQIWASADELKQVDGDSVEPGPNLSYGTGPNLQACSSRGSAATGSAQVKRSETGSFHFSPGEVVSITGSSSHSGITVEPTEVTIPSPWSGGASVNFAFATTVQTWVPNGSYTVTLRATGNSGTTSASFGVAISGCTTTAAPVTDSTPPVLTPVVTGTAGQDGWYTSNVAVSWTVTDAQSAPSIVSGCAPSSLPDSFTSETSGAYSTCSASSAGGTASDSVLIKLDKTAPTGVALSPAGTAGTNGWFTTDVTVSTNGSDSISGVTCTSGQSQTAETTGAVFNGSCTNGAGLTTNASPLTIKLDKSGPSAALAVTSGTVGTNGWYTSDVTVTASGADTISGGVTCVPPTQSVTADTAGTTLNATCTNAAGLSTTADALTIKLDETNPETTLALSGTAGTNGWFTSAVTATTNGADNVSSPLTCTADQLFSADTAGTLVTGSCTNDAGRADEDQKTVKIDRTAPTGVALEVVAGTPGTNGWYTSNVTVRTVGSDSTSGVTCTADQSQTTETDGTVFNGSCTNGAGLTTHAQSITIKLDKTGPSAALAVTAGTPGANGWYTSDVTVSTAGSDSGSGGVTCTTDQNQVTETTGAVFNGSCTNAAGLSTNASPLTVKLDKTGPSAGLAVIAGTPGANGWYTSDVTVSTTGADAISASITCTNPQYQLTDTTGEVFNGSCTNDAGLTTNATPLTIKLDETAPTSSVTGFVDGAVYTLGDAIPSATCAATDTTSGVASHGTLAGEAAPLGTSSFTCSGATDNAGNVQASASAARSYSVQYAWAGWLAPVNALPYRNTVKAGRAIPIKFDLGGDQGMSIFAAPDAPRYQVFACSTGISDPVETTVTAGSSSLQYDGSTELYTYVWKSESSWAGKCMRLSLNLKDASDRVIEFHFTK